MWKRRLTASCVIFIGVLTQLSCVDVCTESDGDFSSKETRYPSNTLIFNRKACEERLGTLIIKLRVLDPRPCPSDHSLKLQVGNRSPESICQLSQGDCFIIQEDYYTCADFSDLQNCFILKWKFTKIDPPIYPVKIIYRRPEQSTHNVRISYSYRQCPEETTTPVSTQAASTTQEQLRSTYQTTMPSPPPTVSVYSVSDTEQFSAENTLGIIFGCLFGVLLVAFIGLSIRHVILMKKLQKGEDIEDRQERPDEDAIYSVVSRTPNVYSEREIVCNEIYSLS